MPNSRVLKNMMMGVKSKIGGAMSDVISTGKKMAKAYRDGKQNERDMFGSGKMKKR